MEIFSTILDLSGAFWDNPQRVLAVFSTMQNLVKIAKKVLIAQKFENIA